MSTYIQEMTNEEIIQQSQLRKVIADANKLRDSLPLGRSFVADMDVPKEKLITILSFITNNIVNIRVSISVAIPVVVIQTCYKDQVIVLRFFDNEAKRTPLIISIDGPGTDMDTFLSDRITQFGFKEIKHLPFSETAFSTKAFWTRFHDSGQPPNLAEFIDICCDKSKLDEYLYFPSYESLELKSMKVHLRIFNAVLFELKDKNNTTFYEILFTDFPEIRHVDPNKAICLQVGYYMLTNYCLIRHDNKETIPDVSDEKLQTFIRSIPEELAGKYEVLTLEVYVPN